MKTLELCSDCADGKKRCTLKNLEDKKEDLFICVGGCGEYSLEDMKPSSDPEDPSVVCPKCGCESFYIIPKKNRID